MTEKQRNIIINFLIWCIGFFVLIFIGVNDVLAWDWTNPNGITYTAVGYVTNDTDILIEVTYETGSGSPLSVAVDQTVNTEIKTLYINLSNYTFLANTRYEIELNLPNNKLVYANSYSVAGNNGEQCIISLSDSVFNSDYARFDFQCPSSTNYVSVSVYNSNNTAITTKGIFSWHYSHLYSSTMPINSSTTNNNDLITNANQNADRIIDNQNQNTQDIINNQNANTDKEIESQKVCITYDKNNISNDNKRLSSTGILEDVDSFGITDYIDIENATIKFTTYNYDWGSYSCFYKSDKTLISCTKNQDLISSFTIPSNTQYVRLSIYKFENLPKIQVCKNGNQVLNDSIKEQTKTSKGILGKIGDLFDNLFSNDDADISGLDNMVGWLPPGPVDSIINLPLSLFNSLTNTLSGTCSPVTLTLPFVNQNLTLPCFDAYMSQYVSGFNTLWTWVGVTVSVFILYRYLLNLYKWIDDTLTMRENNLPGYYDDNMWGGA